MGAKRGTELRDIPAVGTELDESDLIGVNGGTRKNPLEHSWSNGGEIDDLQVW
ncbi:hypothetical protein FHS43_001748 [Streptosporangium becharense]|uniref:Uncharacterized protein n=1 Tax=Streptosporangium becharense TaxID=1816182 RepID=A0A7W9MK41_9ACTN|nr:hypothetical protein [Streptosporangium becharense]MBB2910485.1 hypothetical protein [Streptosporangium becharense]MBB5823228.1 hypothetical protein [Streptosporangium becharense]